jgi:uncharacterized integral membrane protein
MQVAFVVALLFAIAVAVFAVQNTTPVRVSFLWLQAEQVAVSILVPVCTLMGATVTILIGIGRELRRTLALRSLRQQLAAQEQLVGELQTQLEQSSGRRPPPAEGPSEALSESPSADVPTTSQPPSPR